MALAGPRWAGASAGGSGRILLFLKSDKPTGQERRPSTDGASGAAFANTAEEALVAGARSLSEEAWAEIYRRHAPQIYGYLYYRLGDQHVADDLTADVFVRALAGIKGYSWHGTPLLAWLYRIAHNVTADHRKKAARASEHQVREAPIDIEDHRDQVRAMDSQTDMMNAIRSLTEDQQQVIILRFYHGMSNADVARVVGKPEGAVKALQARGLRSLRRFLTGSDERLKSA